MTTRQSEESAHRDSLQECNHEDLWVVDVTTGRVVRRPCPVCAARIGGPTGGRLAGR